MNNPLEDMFAQIDQKIEAKYSEKDYEESYVAFLDILGMKELVKRPYTDLRSVFNAVEAGKELYSNIGIIGGPKFISEGHLKMTIMSDAIVLSISSDIENSFSKLVGISSYLITKLLSAIETPIFLRGGITKGLVYQDSTTVFGPGMVEAYNLENEVAQNMRCIISANLAYDSSVTEYLENQGTALIKDPTDEYYFIHYAKPDVCDQLIAYANSVLATDVKDSVKEKYLWLLKYVESQKIG